MLVLPPVTTYVLRFYYQRVIWYPVTWEGRRRLLGQAFGLCNSKVIFSTSLLVPGSHHPRLSVTFTKVGTVFVNVFAYFNAFIIDTLL